MVVISFHEALTSCVLGCEDEGNNQMADDSDGDASQSKEEDIFVHWISSPAKCHMSHALARDDALVKSN